MPDPLIEQFDAFIRRDPAQRGLIGSESRFGPLCPGHLAEASQHLAKHGRSVAIVTGFFIPRGEPPAAETDGPPGALFLAEALRLAGSTVVVLTDEYCFSAVAAAAKVMRFPESQLVRYPAATGASADRADVTASWRRQFFRDHSHLTHLVAIERVGPSHTLESLSRQPRANEIPFERFEALVPESHRDHCHNMRGEIIDQYAGDVHCLFEEAHEAIPGIRTIGIGDGANEIGMGVIAWEELERRLSGESSGRVPCRIACDWNIVAGTSNWGAFALAAAALYLRESAARLEPFTVAGQHAVLDAMVTEGPAVDGVTRRREATVDGIPFLTYIQPWEGMRRLLGLS